MDLLVKWYKKMGSAQDLMAKKQVTLFFFYVTYFALTYRAERRLSNKTPIKNKNKFHIQIRNPLKRCSENWPQIK